MDDPVHGDRRECSGIFCLLGDHGQSLRILSRVCRGRRRNLYIGKTQVIEVLKPNGDVLRRIDPCTSRGYRFTMDADQTLWIDTGGYLYRTDRFGARIESREIHGDGLSVSVLYEYVSADGTAYRMKNRFLRPCIVRMEEPEDVAIYKMPVFDSAVRLLLIFWRSVFPCRRGAFLP